MIKNGSQEDKQLLVLSTPEEARIYLQQRRLHLVGGKIGDLAVAMGIKPQQVSDMLSGRVALGPRMIKRLNEIDRDYEVLQLIGVAARNPMQTV